MKSLTWTNISLLMALRQRSSGNDEAPSHQGAAQDQRVTVRRAR
jgi:hypothetical protein